MNLTELLTPFSPESRTRSAAQPARRVARRKSAAEIRAARKGVVLTADAVREMRRLKPYDPINKRWLPEPEGKISQRQLAERFGASSGTVHKVLTYQQWKDV